MAVQYRRIGTVKQGPVAPPTGPSVKGRITLDPREFLANPKLRSTVGAASSAGVLEGRRPRARVASDSTARRPFHATGAKQVRRQARRAEKQAERPFHNVSVKQAQRFQRAARQVVSKTAIHDLFASRVAVRRVNKGRPGYLPPDWSGVR